MAIKSGDLLKELIEKFEKKKKFFLTLIFIKKELLKKHLFKFIQEVLI